MRRPPVKTTRRMKLSSMPLILRAVMPTGRIPRSTRDNDHPKRIDEEVDLLGESQAKADSPLVSAKRSLPFILEGSPSQDGPCAHATIWQWVAEGPGHRGQLRLREKPARCRSRGLIGSSRPNLLKSVGPEQQLAGRRAAFVGEGTDCAPRAW
jgi:hypothetical protein